MTPKGGDGVIESPSVYCTLTQARKRRTLLTATPLTSSISNWCFAARGHEMSGFSSTQRGTWFLPG